MKQTYDPINALKEFRKKFQAKGLNSPGIPTEDVIQLQRSLISEEASEFVQATHGDTRDVVKYLTEVADGLCDGLYVHYHAAQAFGLDIVPLFLEVHRSNMTKLWTQNEHIVYHSELGIRPSEYKFELVNIGTGNTRCWLVKRISDSKVIKSPSYSPADLGPLISEQITN